MPLRPLEGSGDIEKALQLVGELLEARGHRYHIVVIGGSALNLLGVVARATTDVDILAFAAPDRGGALQLSRPGAVLPEPLAAAASTVAEDLDLDPHWLNTGPESQWATGLPPGLGERVVWRDYRGLSVGIVDRLDLVFLKLYAAADDVGPQSVHYQDLVALSPSDEELVSAERWVRAQDPTPDFGSVVSKVIEHVQSDRDKTR